LVKFFEWEDLGVFGKKGVRHVGVAAGKVRDLNVREGWKDTASEVRLELV